MQRQAKRFAHKIYTNAGVYVGTLAANIVTSLPAFNWQINGGMGEMQVHLALSLKDFSSTYENQLIKLGNEIRTIIVDSNGSTMRIFDGYITNYEPNMDAGGHQEIVVHVTSTTKTLDDQLFHDGSSTTKSYSSVDPSSIMKDVLTKYGGAVYYTGASITDTSTVVSYMFNYLSYLEAVNIILGLCPGFWYWYIDAYNIFYLHASNFDVVDHKLFIGKQISNIQASKSIEELYNAIYFKGGGDPALYKYYVRTSSITEYGRREYKMQDERVIVAATASTMATKFLDEHDHPRSILTAVVVDDTVDQMRGYDIESFRPGQTVQVKHPQIADKVTLWDVAEWDVDFWDFDLIYSLSLPMQLIEIDYAFDRATIKLSLAATDVAKRIEDIDRNLQTVQAETVPTTPS